jgi:hypothetical protein
MKPVERFSSHAMPSHRGLQNFDNLNRNGLYFGCQYLLVTHIHGIFLVMTSMLSFLQQQRFAWHANISCKRLRAERVFPFTQLSQSRQLARSFEFLRPRSSNFLKTFATSKPQHRQLFAARCKRQNNKNMIPLRLELRTACVLDRSDNQLHHRTN